MKKGVFALLDCLGFKGIWRREPEALLEKLQLLSKTAEAAAQKRIKPFEQPEFRHYKPNVDVKLLSDTIAISITDGPSHYDEVSAMMFVVGDLMDLYIENSPHLMLRGCITYDDHVTHENFLVGPAVDATAEYMNSAQGAFVWFLPPAADMVRKIICPYTAKKNDLLAKLHNSLFPRFKIPIKNSHYIDTYAVNPFFDKTDDEAVRIFELYESALAGNTMDIWMKRQHTLEFLAHCKEKNCIFKKTGGIEIVG